MNKAARGGFMSIGGLILLALGVFIIAFIAFKAIGHANPVLKYSHHDNLAAARKAGVIERGWVPEFLPSASAEIFETHDLDTNVGTGSFIFPSADLDAFKGQARQLAGAKVKEGSTMTYIVYPWERSRVELFLTPSKEEKVMIGVWKMKPIR